MRALELSAVPVFMPGNEHQPLVEVELTQSGVGATIFDQLTSVAPRMTPRSFSRDARSP